MALLDKHCEDENMKPESQTLIQARTCMVLSANGSSEIFVSAKDIIDLFANFTNYVDRSRPYNSFYKHTWIVMENIPITKPSMIVPSK